MPICGDEGLREEAISPNHGHPQLANQKRAPWFQERRTTAGCDQSFVVQYRPPDLKSLSVTIQRRESTMTESALTMRSLKDKVSPEEWAVRVDLAACYRLVSRYGWEDLVFTHISARVPGTQDHFLINPYGLFFDETRPSSLFKIDKQETRRRSRRFPSTPPVSSFTAPFMARAMTPSACS